MFVGAAGIVPWALYGGVAVLAAGALVAAVQQRRELGRPRLLLLTAAVVTCGWCLFTAVPLPDALLAPAGSAHAEIREHARTALTEAHAAGLAERADDGFSLSLNRAGTLRLCLVLVGCWCAGWLTASMSAANKRRYLRFLVAAGAVLALGGLLAQYGEAPGGRIWWVLPVAVERSFGCFVSPNHYGAFLAMVLPAIIAFGVDDIRRREWERLAVWGSALLVFIAGVVASGSRGAYLIMVVSLAATGLVFLIGRSRRTGLALSACVAVALIAVATLTTPAMDKELSTIHRMDGQSLTRLAVWRDGLQLWREFPLAGAGLEAFRMLSPAHARADADRYFHHAESTYVQLLTDTGVIGLLLALGVVAALLYHTIPKVREGRYSYTVLVSATPAVAVVLVHAVYDFAVHVPLYAVVAAGFVGLLVGRPASAFFSHQQVAHNTPPPPSPRQWLLPALLLLALVTTGAVGGVLGGEINRRDREVWARNAH